ncbi:MAG: 3-deoxy-manno-octulosonate cytidylyltransferase [Candidatus Azobacteroides sp.]|nr:3-deoxy-manno-octulosonate cytidylyltransferase [Candidatus Azobacteroides sp.]
MKTLGIIPARYASSRFPGKPLVMIDGLPMIQRVYNQVKNVLDKVVIATDDQKIMEVADGYGSKVIMTSGNHKSGTDRCYEAYSKLEEKYDVIVNIQGDEPFIKPSQIELLLRCFENPTTQIATLVKPYEKEENIFSLENPNTPKVVIDKKKRAIYFSRSVIPYLRNVPKKEWLSSHTYYKHIGLYAYKAEVLKEITSLPPSALEIAESLEQLRWLEAGYVINVGITLEETIGIDTPKDLEKALERIKKEKKNLI